MAAMGVKDSFLGKLLGSADKFSDEQVIQTINLLVESAVKRSASDIHIEPHERFILVRYRIDGVLRGVHKLPIAALPSVSEQLKLMAGLNASDPHLPQEGQYATLVGEDQFQVQVNTLPVVGGEKLVLHIARRLSKPPSLEAIGFWGPSLRLVHAALSNSQGMIVVAAPRRSGKTTTTHSLLQIVNVPSASVATIESSIEYRLQGASQTLVKPQRGVTFSEGLQAALNQDPNVVMVGSLPDKSTASLAVQAAVSGHLIVAGSHADSAASALSHLRTISDEPYLLATAVRAVISQRLVRQLCAQCRERYIPSQEQIAEIEKTFGITSPASRRKIHELEQQAASGGIDHNKHVNSTPSHITALWRVHEEGCEACSHSGYQGSIAIVEVLKITDKTQQDILKHASARQIHEGALKEDFIPMGLDGLVKALRGKTTISEILRTIDS